MTLSSTGGIIFQMASYAGIALGSANIDLLSKLKNPDITTIRLKIITIFNMVTMLITLFLAYYGESTINNNFDTGIKVEIVGFFLTILNLIFSIIIITFLALIKNKSNKNMTPIYVMATFLIICNIVAFITYAFAVNEEEWFN